jgi:microcystin-dependent protein
MAISWGWIQGTAGDIPSYTAQSDRLVLAALHDEGIVRGCKATAGDPARTVIVGFGNFAVTGDDQANQGLYVGTVTVAETVSIPAAPGSGTQHHLVCFKVQDLAAGGPAGNDIVLTVTSGTVGGGVPAVPASAIPVCSVSMTAGQNSVTTAQITDQRVFAETKSAVGTIKLWYGPSTRIPTGWRCLTTTGTPQTIGLFSSFPELADLLGVTSGNIVVADVRGRALVAVNPSDGDFDVVGDLSGSKTTVLTTAHLPVHAHDMTHTHGTGTVAISDPGHAHPEQGRTAGAHLANQWHQRNGAAGSNYDYQAASVRWDSVQYPATASTTTGITATCNVPTFSGNTGNGPGTSTAVPIVQPSVALHVLIRVS